MEIERIKKFLNKKVIFTLTNKSTITSDNWFIDESSNEIRIMINEDKFGNPSDLKPSDIDSIIGVNK